MKKLYLVCVILFLTVSKADWVQFLKSYQDLHSVDQVLKDPNVCDRKFVIGTYACPSMVGNHLHEFMNALAGAYISNRTLLWNFCTRKPCLMDDEESCGLYVKRLPWVPHYKNVLEIWQAAGCAAKKKESTLQV